MRFLDEPPHTFDVYSPVVEQDSEGGSVVNYTIKATGVGGLVRGASSDDQKLFDQIQIFATHVISSKYASMVLNGDKIIYGNHHFRVNGKRQQDSVGMGIPTFYEIYVDEKVSR